MRLSNGNVGRQFLDGGHGVIHDQKLVQGILNTPDVGLEAESVCISELGDIELVITFLHEVVIGGEKDNTGASGPSVPRDDRT